MFSGNFSFIRNFRWTCFRFFLLSTSLLLLAFIFLDGASDLLYREAIYPILRTGFDWSFGLLDITWIYLILPAFIILSVWSWRRIRKSGKSAPAIILSQILFLIALFFWSWGFHYTARDFSQIRTTGNISAGETQAFYRIIAEEVNRQRKALAGFDIEQGTSIKSSMETLRSSLCEVLSKRGLKVHGSPVVREVPYGLLRRIGISGIYIPFSFQAHCDASYLPLSKYYIYCHELSHAYGVCHEAEADLFAWYALKQASSVMEDHFQANLFAYAADIEVLRSLRYRLKMQDPESFKGLDTLISDEVRADLASIRKNGQEYREILPGLSDKVNGAYLQTMGIKEGTKSYDRFTDLLWQEVYAAQSGSGVQQ